MRHHWPPLLQPLLRAHGEERVYRAGLAALGFPPLWIDTGTELLALRAALNAR